VIFGRGMRIFGGANLRLLTSRAVFAKFKFVHQYSVAIQTEQSFVLNFGKKTHIFLESRSKRIS